MASPLVLMAHLYFSPFFYTVCIPLHDPVNSHSLKNHSIVSPNQALVHIRLEPSDQFRYGIVDMITTLYLITNGECPKTSIWPDVSGSFPPFTP